MIIGINGYAQSGKDTVGKIIQYLMSYHTVDTVAKAMKFNYELGKENNWEIKKWAGKLKEVASILTGIPENQFESQEFKESKLSSEWDYQISDYSKGSYSNFRTVPMTVRVLLQRIGTEALRNGLHENVWVNALMADYRCSFCLRTPEEGHVACIREDYPKWVITDTRFPNEAQAIKNVGGIVIRVDRPGVTAINAHPSETALDNWDFDYYINNYADIKYLVKKVDEIMESISKKSKERIP